jgi:hypothetical protein
MSPSDLGRRLKPFVFLDLFDAEGSSLSGFGWHPHSGIATVTYLWEGNVRYEDTTGAMVQFPSIDESCSGGRRATYSGVVFHWLTHTATTGLPFAAAP